MSWGAVYRAGPCGPTVAGATGCARGAPRHTPRHCIQVRSALMTRQRVVVSLIALSVGGLAPLSRAQNRRRASQTGRLSSGPSLGEERQCSWGTSSGSRLRARRSGRLASAWWLIMPGRIPNWRCARSASIAPGRPRWTRFTVQAKDGHDAEWKAFAAKPLPPCRRMDNESVPWRPSSGESGHSRRARGSAAHTGSVYGARCCTAMYGGDTYA